MTYEKYVHHRFVCAPQSQPPVYKVIEVLNPKTHMCLYISNKPEVPFYLCRMRNDGKLALNAHDVFVTRNGERTCEGCEERCRERKA